MYVQVANRSTNADEHASSVDSEGSIAQWLLLRLSNPAAASSNLNATRNLEKFEHRAMRRGVALEHPWHLIEPKNASTVVEY